MSDYTPPWPQACTDAVLAYLRGEVTMAEGAELAGLSSRLFSSRISYYRDRTGMPTQAQRRAAIALPFR